MMLVSILLLLSTFVVVAAEVVTTTSDKTQYNIGETIRFTQVGTLGKLDHYIIPEDDVPILLTQGYLPRYYAGCTTKTVSTVNDTTTSNLECPFSWKEINALTAVLTNYAFSPDSEFPFKTNVSIISSKKLDTTFVYVIIDWVCDDIGIRNIVLTISNPFTFELNDISITLDKTSYIQGEIMQLAFQLSNLTALVPSYDDQLYVKVYEVPFSYKNDLLKFNNATQVKFTASESNLSFPIDKQLITWQKSGQFQLVLFQKYYHVAIAVSDVFSVRLGTNLTQFSVSMDNRTYYPQQYISFDVTTPTMISGQSLVGREVSFTFVNAGTTQRDLSDARKILDTFTQTWTSSTSSQQFLVLNTMVKRGFHKVFVSISALSGRTNYAVHTTKAFRVVIPLIAMTTIPNRRRFIQGEVIDFDFYNPYFDFELARNEYRGYSLVVVDSKFPNPLDINPARPDGDDYLPSIAQNTDYYRNFRIDLPPGQYKMVIFREIYGTGGQYMTYVPNSYFTVVSNNFTVTTDKVHYTKGDSIVVRLSSSRNIPLSAMTPFYWELTIKENDDPNYPDHFHLSGSFDQSSSVTKLFLAILIFWDATGIFSFGTSNGFAKTEFVIR